MYPSISDLLRDLFGLNIALPVQTFGAFMALSFVAAYHTTSSELKRKNKMGLLNPVLRTVTKNSPVTITNYLVSMLVAGFLGFKILEAIFDYASLVENPQAFFISSKGNIAGLFIGVLIGYYSTYREAQKVKGKTPETVTEYVPPHELMWNITAIAGISGILGAKIFHNLEYIEDFMVDPIDALLSFSGLTFYGGLIVATFAVLYYTRRHHISTKHMIDAAAPGLMLAYGIGRIGCQLSGDGDWGIVNLAPKPEWMSFLPDWTWSYDYAHNVIDAGVPIPGCSGPHCYRLPEPVYPTPFYEVIMALALFAFLWLIRKRIRIPGMLFCIYLVVNGIERFLIEKIRVNSTYDIFGHAITQAELISTFMVIGGLAGMIILARNRRNETPRTSS